MLICANLWPQSAYSFSGTALTGHGLVSQAGATMLAAGANVFMIEAAEGPELIVAALPGALAQGSLYAKAEQDEDGNPQTYKNNFNHNNETLLSSCYAMPN